ncbi:ferrienterobactin ABC transporter permease [Erysipelotrichaceae bacterium]|nr:ferrienterobactin ABC transporter permease [Erysipelotrichaceae bacterium]
MKKIIILAIIAMILTLLYLFYGIDAEIFQYSFMKRLPQAIAIGVTATAIAIATLLFQTITNNRILTPSILGFDAIYLFIQTILVVFFTKFAGNFVNETVNFILSLVIMVGFSLLLFSSIFKEKYNIHTLLLVGIVFGTLFRSMTGFLLMILDPNEFGLLQGRMFASFNNIKTELLLIVIVGFLLLIPFIYDEWKKMDVFLLGKDVATNLGVDYQKTSKKFFIVISILISAATALVGPLTFLGVIVVNLAYEIMQTYKHKYIGLAAVLICVSALMGGQLIVERVFNFNITLTVIINLVGGIYFLTLLMKGRKA